MTIDLGNLDGNTVEAPVTAPEQIIDATAAPVDAAAPAETAALNGETPAAAPAEPKKRGRKKSTETVVKEPKAPKEAPVVVIPDNYKSLLEVITTLHKDKLTGVKKIDLNISNVPQGKYVLFVTLDPADAAVMMFEQPGKYYIDISEAPVSIVPRNSGMVITTANKRIYAYRSSVVQFDLNEQKVPTVCKLVKLTKKGISVEENKVKNATAATLDEVKLRIKHNAPSLEKAVSEMVNTSDILKTVLDFMATVDDLNYLLKIEREILMSCF